MSEITMTRKQLEQVAMRELRRTCSPKKAKQYFDSIQPGVAELQCHVMKQQGITVHIKEENAA